MEIDPEMPDSAMPTSPFDYAYRGILKAIYENAFVPGQRLVAPDLMQRFDVGRGTIREVLHRLASSGAVTIIPNRGAQVRLLSREDVFDLLDVVEVLLGLASRRAALAIGNGSSADELSALFCELNAPQSNGSATSFFLVRERYYRCLVQLSSSYEIQRLFPSLQVHLMRVQLRRFQNAGDAMPIEDYRLLTDAILSGNPARAEDAGRKHVGFTRARIQHLPDEAFATEPRPRAKVH